MRELFLAGLGAALVITFMLALYAVLRAGPVELDIRGRRATPFHAWGSTRRDVAAFLDRKRRGRETAMVEKFGITTPEEVGVDTLSERLHEESVTSGGVVKFRELVSAWVRKPQRRLYHPSA